MSQHEDMTKTYDEVNEVSNLEENNDSSMIIHLCKEYIAGGQLLDLTIDSKRTFAKLYRETLQTHGLSPMSLLLKANRKSSFTSDLVLSNVHTFPLFPSHKEYFEIVLANNVFPYFNDLSILIKEVQQLLKPNGIFVFTYEKSLNRFNDDSQVFCLEEQSDKPTIYAHFDGYVQKLLIKNNFYIQKEQEYQVNSQKKTECVAIVAQKKPNPKTANI